MSLWKIAWRSIQQRSLASSLTGISMALGVTLVVAVLVIHGVINQSFLNNSGLGYNIVVGAKGGRLELALNTVYYLGRPVENIPYSYYLEFTEGKFKGFAEKAIPVCLGDSYQNFRVIGTTHEFFRDLEYGGKKYEFAEGRNFEPDEYNGAVIGATVARETGLKKGDTFAPSHGTGETAEQHEHDPFTVLGVLKPTGTPNDRGLFINMEGFFLIEGHAKEEEEAEANKEKHSDGEHGDHKHGDHEDAEMEGHAEEGHKHADDAPNPAKDEANPSIDPVVTPDPNAAGAKNDDAKNGDPAATPTEEHVEGPKHEHADDHGHKHAEGEKHEHDAHDEKKGGHEHGHSHEHGHAHGHGHDHGHAHVHEPLPIAQREVTAILVLTASVPTGFTGQDGKPVMTPPEALAPSLIKTINKGSVAQAVQPIREMSTLFNMFVDPLRIILLSLTVMIVIVSGISILVSIYNSMNERQHEIAVIRALGAGRRTVMLLVLLESILLSVAGGLLGWVVGHGLIAALSPWIAQQTGVSIGFLQFVGYELVIIPGLIVLAALVGYLPAMAAYRTDVAKALSATP